MAITVGSVEVDVVPNTRNIYARLRSGLTGPADSVGSEMGRIIGRHITVNVVDAMRNGIQRGGQQAATAAGRQGSDAGGAFGRSFRSRVEAAVRSLPDITIGADTTEADADIRALREQLHQLSTQRVGIDVDTATARRQIEAVERELQRLGASSPDIAVRVNTAAAVAQLAALRTEIDAIDGREIDVRVDPAVRSFGMLVTAAAAFGPAILPVLPVVLAGLGAIASAGVAAAAGIGAVGLVGVPAIKDIAGALQAQKAAQDAATSSTNSGAAAAVAAQQKAIQQASARQALAAAERNAARQVAAAQEQVSQARQRAALAAEQAAQRTADAARQVRDAERDLRDAQEDAVRAQEDLTRARKSAADQLRDMNKRLADGALDERAAVLRVQEAEAELTAVRKLGSKASQLDQDRAQLAYDQAVKALGDQRQEQARLAAEVDAANKAGVDGSDTVRAAQERLKDAQEQVADRTEAVTDAQSEQARVAVQNSRDIAEAQGRIGDAVKGVATAQQQAADSIASAQRQVASSQIQAATTASAAATAQAKYQAALAKLTPSARETMTAFTGLRTAFGDWSRSLQPAVMPLFTRALDGLKNSLPGLTPIVLAAATAIGNLQDRASAGFKSPWWKEFKADLTGAVQPALEGLGVAFGNIFKGMAGVLQAFFPHMDGISSRMQTITERFANWGSSLKGSPAFERFLAYSAEHAPFVAELLGNLFGALFNVGAALAPLAGTATAFLNALADGVSAIPVNVLTVVGVAFASIAIGAKLAAIALGIWRTAVMAATLVTAIMTGQVWALNTAMRANLIGLIITAIIALVVAIVYAYQNSETFRQVVQNAWEGIKATVSWIWENVLQPIFRALVVAFKAIADAAVWLWETVLKPTFTFIGDAAALLATIILTVLVAPLVIAFKGLAVVAEWLWQNVLKPAFEGIAADATWLWRNILSPVFQAIAAAAKWLWEYGVKPAFENFKRGFRQIGDAAKWVWDSILKPVFGWVGDKAGWLWEKALKPAFSNIKSGIDSVGKSFDTARGFIDTAWSKISDIAKKPVRFIIDKVYNGGIVPTWNLIADAFGAPKIEKMKTEGWATGGVLPGYTPGKDVHKFYSATGGGLELSGGEAIMRPEFTRAVGSGFVNGMNAIARSRGMAGVKAALAPALGGSAPVATDHSLKYADGGIFGWIGDKVAGAGSAAWNGIKSSADWLTDTMASSARAGLNSVVDPLLAQFPGADTDFGRMLRRIPTRIVDSIFGYSKEADKRGAGGIGGPRIQKALSWARTQNGLPYQWGGNGNPSWDCSGFMSAIESVIRGQKPHRRWATGAFSGKTAPPGWVLGGKSPFMIGITNAGVGHTAGTIGGVNVESRGGDGVVVGPRAAISSPASIWPTTAPVGRSRSLRPPRPTPWAAWPVRGERSGSSPVTRSRSSWTGRSSTATSTPGPTARSRAWSTRPLWRPVRGEGGSGARDRPRDKALTCHGVEPFCHGLCHGPGLQCHGLVTPHLAPVCGPARTLRRGCVFGADPARRRAASPPHAQGLCRVPPADTQGRAPGRAPTMPRYAGRTAGRTGPGHVQTGSPPVWGVDRGNPGAQPSAQCCSTAGQGCSVGCSGPAQVAL
ncbi:hypothetical protein [Streptomyces flavochromogenes]|uniref:hypothetical protein n=1 Tax=Streptomyces flavochromogenes TaxID=68199 RepID=UPI000690C14C|nr:hypothetical protein [Streptomyces flavochromogenes]